MYKGAEGAPGQGEQGTPEADQASPDEVTDVDFEEVKDDEK